MFVFGLLLVGVATAFSLVWIYTGGRLDQNSIEKALPVIRRDVDVTLTTLGITELRNVYIIELF